MRWSLWVLVLCQPLDYATTALLLGSGAGSEANPIAATLIAIGGLSLLLAIKMMVVSFVVVKAWALARLNPEVRARTARRIRVVAAVYVTVVAWNGWQILSI